MRKITLAIIAAFVTLSIAFIGLGSVGVAAETIAMGLPGHSPHVLSEVVMGLPGYSPHIISDVVMGLPGYSPHALTNVLA